MKKEGKILLALICLGFVLAGVLFGSFASAESCSDTGYRYRIYYRCVNCYENQCPNCPTGDPLECDVNCNPIRRDTQCLNANKKLELLATLPYTWTCADSWNTSDWYCNNTDGFAYAKKLIGVCGSLTSGDYNCNTNCGTSTPGSYLHYSAFDYLCCIPKTCADYAGQCGTGFANGTCGSTFNCNCTPEYACNVSTGQGSCILIPICNNSEIQTGESCDDGNLRSGDGCNSTCGIEPGWYCSPASGTGPSICTGLHPGINVMINITSPINSANYVNGIVRFNASQSYVYNCTQGACPAGQTCVVQAADLNCSYAHAPGTLTTSGYNLTLNWTITSQAPVVGDWNNNANVVFSEPYTEAGSYSALLNLKYSSGSTLREANASVNFLTSGGWNCTNNATTAFWMNALSSVNATNNCTLYSSSNYHSCCPLNLNNCNGTSGRCYAETITNCNQYHDAASCNVAPLSIAKNSINNSAKCGTSSKFTDGLLTCVNITDCGCYWYAENNTCLGTKNYTRNCDVGTPEGQATWLGQCAWLPAAEENKCNSAENLININSASNWYPAYTGEPRPDDCTDLNRIYPCVSTAKLDFWTDTSIFILIGIIIGVYAYINRR